MFSLTQDVLSTAASATGGVRCRVLSGPPQTDGKNIYLPGIKDNLTPSEAQILRGYFDHEVAHIRYRSFRAMKGVRRQHLISMFNAVEDVRIEAKSKHELPGTVATIAAINAACLAADRTGHTMTAYDQTTHAVAWYGQGVGRDRAAYCPEGWAVLDAMNLDQYDAFLSDVVNKTSVDAMRIAEDLEKQARAIIKEFNKTDVPKPEPGEDGDGDQPGESGESGESGDNGGSGGDNGDGDGGDGGDSDGGDQPGSPSSTVGDSTDGKGGTGVSKGSKWDGSANADDANRIADGIGGMVDMRNTPDEYDASIMESAIQQAGQISPSAGRPALTYPEFHSDAMQIARTLQDRLVARDRTSWSLPRESGHRIDRRTLPGVASGQTVSAFNRRRVDRAIHTKVSILLDNSGSMSSCFDTAIRAAWTIADATESLGCPTQIIQFGSYITLVKAPGRVTAATQIRGYCSGGTNLLPALLRERVTAEDHPKHRRVVFLISDGGTSGGVVCREFIEKQRAAGVTYFALCIDMEPHSVHHACDHVVRCSARDLTRTMHTGLRSL